MLVFLSWDWSFCHGFISLSLCIVCVCVASCHLCLPEFHAFLGLCPPSILLLSIQSSIKSSIPWLFLLTPLIYLSLSSSVIFVHLFDHPYPSDYFDGNIGISLLRFTKRITGTKGIRTRKWKWLERNHFVFNHLQTRGDIQNWPDYLFYDVYQEFLSILHFGKCCFNYYFARNQSPRDRLNKSYIIAFE